MTDVTIESMNRDTIPQNVRGVKMQTSGAITSHCRFTAIKTLGSSLGASLAIYCVIFAISSCAFGQTVTTIHDFGSGPDGENPQSGVIFDQDGHLFGSVALGGISGDGVIYTLTPAGDGVSWTESILYQFKGRPDGQTPDSILTMSPTGKLFGTTQLGGTKNVGTVFMVIPPAAPGGRGKERILYSFGTISHDGASPNVGLLPGSHGFYGVTSAGGANGRGTIFHLVPASNPADPWIETILHNFAGADGAFPSSDLVMDSEGNLYGTTLLGGANDVGTVYRLTPPTMSGGTWTESVLFSFGGPDGSSPFGRLQLDGDDVLYGTTSGGGASQAGTVFRLIAPEQPGDSWTESVLYSFSGGRDGGSPEAGVIIGNQGRLIGTASTGGSGGPDFGGVVFVLNPPTVPGGSWTETVLHSFGGPNGFRPLSRLVGRNGAMYGTTSAGGRNGTGTVFVLTP
jgi:uncharacterized repeat protein (TIGR03803 family)